MSTEQLCLAWQRSYFTLLDTPAGPARCHVVALREGLLDELERRDRAGFTRWLDADARANSNPGPYLDTDERPAACRDQPDASNGIVVRYLNAVGLAERDPFHCPLVRQYRA